MDEKEKARRPWLVLVIVGVAAAGAWYSWSQRVASPVGTLDLRSGRPRLIELGMGICAQCKRMKPVMERAARELRPSVDVQVLDIRRAANHRIAERYQMRVMPLVLLIDGNGRELWRHEGYIGFDELRAAVIAQLGEHIPR